MFNYFKLKTQEIKNYNKNNLSKRTPDLKNIREEHKLPENHIFSFSGIFLKKSHIKELGKFVKKGWIKKEDVFFLIKAYLTISVMSESREETIESVGQSSNESLKEFDTSVETLVKEGFSLKSILIAFGALSSLKHNKKFLKSMFNFKPFEEKKEYVSPKKKVYQYVTIDPQKKTYERYEKKESELTKDQYLILKDLLPGDIVHLKNNNTIYFEKKVMIKESIWHYDVSFFQIEKDTEDDLELQILDNLDNFALIQEILSKEYKDKIKSHQRMNLPEDTESEFEKSVLNAVTANGNRYYLENRTEDDKNYYIFLYLHGSVLAKKEKKEEISLEEIKTIVNIMYGKIIAEYYFSDVYIPTLNEK